MGGVHLDFWSGIGCALEHADSVLPCSPNFQNHKYCHAPPNVRRYVVSCTVFLGPEGKAESVNSASPEHADSQAKMNNVGSITRFTQSKVHLHEASGQNRPDTLCFRVALSIKLDASLLPSARILFFFFLFSSFSIKTSLDANESLFRQWSTPD